MQLIKTLKFKLLFILLTIFSLENVPVNDYYVLLLTGQVILKN